MMFNGDKDWEKKFEALHRTKPGKFISASDDPNLLLTMNLVMLRQYLGEVIPLFMVW